VELPRQTPSPFKHPVPSASRTRATLFQEPSPAAQQLVKVELDKIVAAAEIVPLDSLVTKAQKSLRTTDYMQANTEKLNVAILSRISELKEQHLWSLRQPSKQKTPPRRNVHWDYLLKEMEWLSTDIYQEKKWKMRAASILVQAVKEFHESTDRKHLLHKVYLSPIKLTM